MDGKSKLERAFNINSQDSIRLEPFIKLFHNLWKTNLKINHQPAIETIVPIVAAIAALSLSREIQLSPEAIAAIVVHPAPAVESRRSRVSGRRFCPGSDWGNLTSRIRLSKNLPLENPLSQHRRLQRKNPKNLTALAQRLRIVVSTWEILISLRRNRNWNSFSAG